MPEPGLDVEDLGRAAPFVRTDLAWGQILPPDAAASPKLRDLYRGCLLWGAVGDALGRPAEGRRPEALRKRYGDDDLARFQPWRDYSGGPLGTITDDTQQTMLIAESYLAANGRLDPDDVASRLGDWLKVGRGKGKGTTAVLEMIKCDVPWREAAQRVNSSGNGAAMRAAPVGLRWALAPSPEPLARDAALSALPTHAAPVGVLGATTIALGVAWCLRQALLEERFLDPESFLKFVVGSIDGLEAEPSLERGPDGRKVRLAERLAEIGGLLATPDPAAVFAYLYNGAYALESVPAAVYCFLRSPNDPAQVLLTAVYAGHDADTVASMAGNLAGAWVGAQRLHEERPEWWEELEYRDDLITLADGLLGIALEDVR